MCRAILEARSSCPQTVQLVLSIFLGLLNESTRPGTRGTMGIGIVGKRAAGVRDKLEERLRLEEVLGRLSLSSALIEEDPLPLA